MSRRRAARRELQPEKLPPGASRQRCCTWLLVGLFFTLQGMVILFGGTRFWASAPFLMVALLLCSLLFFLQFWWARDEPGTVHLSLEFWGIMLCATYAAIRAVIGSAVPFESWTESYLLLCAALLWVAFVRLGSSRNAWLLLSLLYLAAGTLHSMWALRQHVLGERSVLWLPRPEHYGMRASGTFICPNHFGFMLQMGVIVALGLMLMPRLRLSLKIFAGYAWLVMCSALVLTLSRAAILGALAGMGVIFLLSPFRKRIKLLLSVGSGALILLAGGLMAAYSTYPPVRARFGDFGTNNIRWGAIWPDTLGMIRGEGLWGSGPGTYVHVFDLYREKFKASWMYLEYAHNEFLHVLAEYGWIPFLGILMGATLVCVRLAKASWTQGPTRTGMIPGIMLALWVGLLTQAAFDFQLHITAAALSWVMLVATYHGAATVRGCWSSSVMSVRSSRYMFGVVGIMSMLLLWPSLHLAVGSAHGYGNRLARETNDLERAARHSEKQRQWLPGWYRGWRALGLEKRTAGFWMRDPEQKTLLIQESRDAYETAIAMNPYDRISRAGLVELYKMENRWEEALTALEALKKLAPHDVQVRVQEGLVLKRMGRTREALGVFQEARRLNREPDRQIDLNIRRLRERLENEAS